MEDNIQENKLAETQSKSEKAMRIHKSDEIALFNLFKAEVKDAVILTTPMRTKIVSNWQKLFPDVPEGNLRVYLSRMEQKYWGSQPPWKKQELQNKITAENEMMKTKLIEAEDQPLLRRIKIINELNETTAKVNNLAETPPVQSIFINTNAGDGLMSGMNSGWIDTEAVDPKPSTDSPEEA